MVGKDNRSVIFITFRVFRVGRWAMTFHESREGRWAVTCHVSREGRRVIAFHDSRGGRWAITRGVSRRVDGPSHVVYLGKVDGHHML